MRILRRPDPSSPHPEVPRLDPLLDKMASLEERLRVLEQSQKPQKSSAPLALVTLDADAFKKALLTKMWKYLHDERSPKTV